MKIVRLEDMKKSGSVLTLSPKAKPKLSWKPKAGGTMHVAKTPHGVYTQHHNTRGSLTTFKPKTAMAGATPQRVHSGRQSTGREAALNHHNAMSKGESLNLNDLVKAEGARGGHVMGHTKSGKPIYTPSSSFVDEHAHQRNTFGGSASSSEDWHDEKVEHLARHKGFTADDHKDAAKLHGKIAKKFAAVEAKHPVPYVEHHGSHIHSTLAQLHEKRAANPSHYAHYSYDDADKSEKQETIKGETHMSKSNASSIDDIFKGEDNEEIKVIEVEMDGETIQVPLSEVQKSLEALKNGEVHKAQSVAKDNKKGRKTVGHGGQEKEPRANGAGAGRPTPTTDKTIKADEEGSDDEKVTKAAACKSCGKAGDLCKCSHTGKMKKGEETQEPLVKALGGSEAVMYVENNTSLGDRAVAEMIAKSNGLGQGIIDSIRNPQMEKR